MSNKQKNISAATSEFLESLHEEKLKHKQHRVDFVKQKLIFTIGLFSIGALEQINLGGSSLELSDLLLFVPIVALAFDIYIFAEDFKVKRIGIFIFERCDPSEEERNWEDWLSFPKHREQTALFASAMLTIVALIASFLVLQAFANTSKPNTTNLLSNNSENIFWWFLVSAASLGLVFEVTTYIRDQLVAPLRNRLNISKLYFGLLFVFFGLAAILYMGISYGNYDWKNHSPLLTLIVGSTFSVWLFVLQRIRREIIWRHKGRFSIIDFEIRPIFEENGDLDNKKKVTEAYLCGDFTKWMINKIKMEEVVDEGYFKCEVALEAGKKYEYKYFTIDKDNMEYWFNGVGQEKKVLNEGWNQNNELPVEYTKHRALKGLSKYLKNLYS